MSKYIDKDEVLEIVSNMSECDDDYVRITEWVRSMPSIDIVRCKECRHWRAYETWSECELWTDDPYETAKTKADDFCSYGERREP